MIEEIYKRWCRSYTNLKNHMFLKKFNTFNEESDRYQLTYSDSVS